MMQRSVSNLAVLLALCLVAKVHSFAPSSPFLSARVLAHRCASSVQVQTLSDESAATEQASEAPVADVPPVVVSEAADGVEVAAPKRKVERTRYTAFVGNLPYGT